MVYFERRFYMAKCFVCGKTLTKDNRTVEHIFPNALGGKLKSSDLLCSSCNSEIGEQIDAELVKQLNPFMLFLNVKRQRGKSQPVIFTAKDGKQFYLNQEGQILEKDKHEIEETKEEDKVIIKAKNIKVLRNYMKRKYPQISEEEIIQNSKTNTEYGDSIEMKLQVSFGGEKALLANLKIAIEYFLYSGLDTNDVQDAINDLRSQKTKRVELLVGQSITLCPAKNDFYNSIMLCCDGESRKAYVIIEFFSSIQVLIKLTDRYSGKTLSKLYSEGTKSTEIKEIENLKFPITTEEAFGFEYPLSNPNFNEPQKSIGSLLSAAFSYEDSPLSKLQKEKVDIIVQQAIDETICKMIPEGEPITEEAYKLFCDRLIELVQNNFYIK